MTDRCGVEFGFPKYTTKLNRPIHIVTYIVDFLLFFSTFDLYDSP